MDRSPDFHQRLQQLRRFLNKHQEGGYMFVRVESDGMAVELVRMLEQSGQLDGLHLKWLTWSDASESTLAEQILNRAAQLQRPAGVLVSGLNGSSPELDRVLSALNFAREDLTQAKIPIVFFLDPVSMNRLRHLASDLHSQRSRSTVEFSESPTMFREVSLSQPNALEPDLSDRSVEDPRGTELRLALLKKQWEEAEAAGRSDQYLYETLGLQLAQTHRAMGTFSEAKDLLLRMEGYFLGVGKPLLLAETYQELGRILKEEGKLDKAFRQYSRQAALGKSYLSEHPDNISARVLWANGETLQGVILSAKGKLERSFSHFQTAQRIVEEGLVRFPHSETLKNRLAISYERLGSVYESLGKLELALEFFQNYNRITQELSAANPQSESLKSGLAVSNGRLGDVYMSLGQLGIALEFFKEVAAIFQELSAANPQSESLKNGLAISYSKLGEVYQSLGKLEQALEFFRSETAIFQELSAANPQSEKLNWGVLVSRVKLGGVYTEKSQFQTARKYYKEALRIAEKLVDTNPIPKHQKALSFILDRLP